MDQNPFQFQLSALNARIGSKLDLYNILSKKYHLPCYNSRALSKRYLSLYLANPCPIFRFEKVNAKPIFVISYKTSAGQLLIIIEKVLRERKLNPTGMTKECPPDLAWLTDLYFYLCPKDEFSLFGHILKSDKEPSLLINPE